MEKEESLKSLHDYITRRVRELTRIIKDNTAELNELNNYKKTIEALIEGVDKE